MEVTTHLLFPRGVDVATGLGRPLAIVKMVQAEIFAVCDETGVSSLTSERWVIRWPTPLYKIFRRTLASAQGNTSELPGLIDGFFVQVRNQLEQDNKGPSAFTLLSRLLTPHFDTGNQSLGFTQLHSCGLPPKTHFAVCFRRARYIASITKDTENMFKPTDAIVVEHVLSSPS